MTLNQNGKIEISPSLTHTVTVSFRLDLPEGMIEASIELSKKGETLSGLATKLLPLSTEIVRIGTRHVNKLGFQVSCQSGCGECCRQLVPVSLPEAILIAEHVASLGPARQHHIKNNFAKNLDKLRQAHLLSQLKKTMWDAPSESEHSTFARTYFSLGIPCPFLYNEACSIYDHRPSMCREYTVLTAPELCGNPFKNEVKRLPVSFKLSEALAWTHAELLNQPPRIIPLILTLEYADTLPKKIEQRHNPEKLLQLILNNIHTLAQKCPISQKENTGK